MCNTLSNPWLAEINLWKITTPSFHQLLFHGRMHWHLSTLTLPIRLGALAMRLTVDMCFRVKLLLEKGADVNAQGGYFGNALQAAAFGGHEAIVQLLLEEGADVNSQGGKYGNALQVASAMGHMPIVQLLLAKGANFDNPHNLDDSFEASDVGDSH